MKSIMIILSFSLLLVAGCAEKDEAREAYKGPGPAKAGAPGAAPGADVPQKPVPPSNKGVGRE